jgi:hypothetical protein
MPPAGHSGSGMAGKLLAGDDDGTRLVVLTPTARSCVMDDLAKQGVIVKQSGAVRAKVRPWPSKGRTARVATPQFVGNAPGNRDADRTDRLATRSTLNTDSGTLFRWHTASYWSGAGYTP